jgi:FAD/FMN-containing dehydrogenase
VLGTVYGRACLASQPRAVPYVGRSGVTDSRLDWDALSGVVVGEVVIPGSPGYDVVRKPAMARFEAVRPAGIVRCVTPGDVAQAILFARRAGLGLSVRCGGHSVAGRSSGAGLVIDVSPMRSVSISNGIASVGAGIRLGELYEALYEHGVTVPAGCGPSVGIAGLTLGGGIGILGRSYGLTCDRLRRAQIVLADGRLVECDEAQEPDLFWALRGAGGGNFGVVTSFEFETVPAPQTTVFYLRWSFPHAVALVESWQAWAPTAATEVDATLRLSAGADAGSAQVELLGGVLASEAVAREHLDTFSARLGATPSSKRFRQLAYPQAKRYLDELDQHREAPPAASTTRGHVYTKSEFFRQQLGRETIASLVDTLAQPAAGARSREVAFMPWGGAYNSPASDATAFPHRSELFLVQHLLEADAQATEADRDAARDWLTRSWQLLRRFGSGGVYPNFPDPDLADWQQAYHDENYRRLVKVKAAYDPHNVFRFHQSLPPVPADALPDDLG